MLITKKYLQEHPNHIFVFGDNLIHKGYGGAASLRDEPNTYGFLTKKLPNNIDSSFYKPEDYSSVFNEELSKLEKYMFNCENSLFLISQLGGGLANKYNIWEKVIKKELLKLPLRHNNIRLLF